MVAQKLPKKKVTASTASPVHSIPILKVAQLEESLLAKPYNPNKLVPLVSLSRHDDPEVVHKAVWALHRVFIRYIGEGKVGGITSASSSDSGAKVEEHEAGQDRSGGKQVKSWVRERFFEYVEVLGGLCRDKEDGLRVSR
jgi:U3 small nucleolar RNA-associated protein 19